MRIWKWRTSCHKTVRHPLKWCIHIWTGPCLFPYEFHRLNVTPHLLLLQENDSVSSFHLPPCSCPLSLVWARVGVRPGSGTLSWAGEDRAEPHQYRPALMTGQAAGRPPGYADHGLIGLMRCSSSSARSSTAGRSCTKQGGEAHCLSLWVIKTNRFYLPLIFPEARDIRE